MTDNDLIPGLKEGLTRGFTREEYAENQLGHIFADIERRWPNRPSIEIKGNSYEMPPPRANEQDDPGQPRPAKQLTLLQQAMRQAIPRPPTALQLLMMGGDASEEKPDHLQDTLNTMPSALENQDVQPVSGTGENGPTLQQLLKKSPKVQAAKPKNAATKVLPMPLSTSLQHDGRHATVEYQIPTEYYQADEPQTSNLVKRWFMEPELHQRQGNLLKLMTLGHAASTINRRLTDANGLQRFWLSQTPPIDYPYSLEHIKLYLFACVEQGERTVRPKMSNLIHLLTQPPLSPTTLRPYELASGTLTSRAINIVEKDVKRILIKFLAQQARPIDLLQLLTLWPDLKPGTKFAILLWLELGCRMCTLLEITQQEVSITITELTVLIRKHKVATKEDYTVRIGCNCHEELGSRLCILHNDEVELHLPIDFKDLKAAMKTLGVTQHSGRISNALYARHLLEKGVHYNADRFALERDWGNFSLELYYTRTWAGVGGMIVPTYGCMRHLLLGPDTEDRDYSTKKMFKPPKNPEELRAAIAAAEKDLCKAEIQDYKELLWLEESGDFELPKVQAARTDDRAARARVINQNELMARGVTQVEQLVVAHGLKPGAAANKLKEQLRTARATKTKAKAKAKATLAKLEGKMGRTSKSDGKVVKTKIQKPKVQVEKAPPSNVPLRKDGDKLIKADKGDYLEDPLYACSPIKGPSKDKEAQAGTDPDKKQTLDEGLTAGPESEK
jgi:hypothetical protein